jgi:hypothetical protein
MKNALRRPSSLPFFFHSFFFHFSKAAPVNSSAETKIVDACRQVKAAKPEIMCLFYLNSLVACLEYSI